jgi:hypothetical protein
VGSDNTRIPDREPSLILLFWLELATFRGPFLELFSASGYFGKEITVFIVLQINTDMVNGENINFAKSIILQYVSGIGKAMPLQAWTDP